MAKSFFNDVEAIEPGSRIGGFQKEVHRDIVLLLIKGNTAQFEQRHRSEGMIAHAAGQQAEITAMHIRAALRNGLTPDEIKEVLLQTAIYCGVPAANSAFAIAQEVIAEEPPA